MYRRFVPIIFVIPPMFVGWSWMTRTPDPVRAADLLFWASILVLIAGGVLYIARHEVTETFTKNWRKFFRSLSRKESFIREAEGRKEDPEFKKGPLPYRAVLLFGLYLFMVSIVASVLAME
ncbi:DUF3899 domain-containing protein [Bhargavaea ginsengi]|uniref:DUF3899 domain-containing protein n=1 Tax=Bhargavaea ginsengi TaxID=426757 RepID=UPI003C7238E3